MTTVQRRQMINRERFAARAASKRGSLPSERARLNPAAPVTGSGHVGRKGKRPGSDKGQGEWRTTSPYYSTAATVDVRWSA